MVNVVTMIKYNIIRECGMCGECVYNDWIQYNKRMCKCGYNDWIHYNKKMWHGWWMWLQWLNTL